MQRSPMKSQGSQSALHRSKTPTKSQKPQRNQSRSPLSKVPTRPQLLLGKSPMKTKFNSEMQHLQSQMQSNRQRLREYLQVYQKLDTATRNLRCLQHDNTLTLYCLNQRRVLCVSCLYGVHRHRAHKVVPLKDCIHQVYEDNKLMKGLIQEEIRGLDLVKKIADDNVTVLEDQMRKTREELDREYKAKLDEIGKVYEQAKRQIEDTFEPLIQTCRKVKDTTDGFRFSVWQAYTMYINWKQTDESEIMKQLLFVTILELCEFRNRSITKHQLQSLERRLRNYFVNFK